MDAGDILFGEIAVSRGFITHEQLVECLMAQSRRPSKRIGELARELGFISDRELSQVLAEQENRGVAPPPKPPQEQPQRRMSPSMEVLLSDYVDDPSAASPLPPTREAEVGGAVRRLAREQQRSRTSQQPEIKSASLDRMLEGYVDGAASAAQNDAASRATVDAPPIAASRQPSAASTLDVARHEHLVDLGDISAPDGGEARAEEPALQPSRSRAAKPPAPNLSRKPRPAPQAGRNDAPATAPPSAPARKPPGQPSSARPSAPPSAPPQKPAGQPSSARPSARPSAPPQQPSASPSPHRAPAAEPPPPREQKAPPEPPCGPRLTESVAVRPQDLTAGAQLVEKIVEQAHQQHASDVHLHTGAPPLLRVHGRLAPLGDRAIDAEMMEQAIASLTNDTQWATFARSGEVDFALELRSGGRARVNAYRQQRGADVVMRLVPAAPPSLAELALPDELGHYIDNATGMVLCTGPTGCGKSTTMAALVALVAERRAGHVITVEDPIEYVFDAGSRSLINQRQLGDHTRSCARALRAALREDPDVIAITELRDRETIALAMTAAETGHLVLGTLHTGDAAQTINRIINAFPAPQQPQIRTMLSESLRVVISQRLVAKRGGGRVPALEVLVVNNAVANMIRDGKTHQLPSAMQVGKAHGMHVLDDSLERLVADQVIDVEEARRYATKPERFGGAARS